MTNNNTPEDIIAYNNTHRYIDVDVDLISVDTLSNETYNFEVPTIVPSNWTGDFTPVTQKEYDSLFIEKHYIMRKVLLNTKHIVVAGGAAARPLYIDKNINTDIDIFIYGIFEEDEFWEKVNEIATKIINYSIADPHSKNVKVTQKMKKGIVMLIVYCDDYTNTFEYQIILRMYHTLSSIIHAFDIPSCCIAYDGVVAYTTTLGAYAITNQINLVSTNYRSTSFEQRLTKYFNRGFGIALIGYNLNAGYVRNRSGESKLKHSYLDIEVLNKQDNKIVGNIRPLGRYTNKKEYNTIQPRKCSYKEIVLEIQCIEEYGIELIKRSTQLIDYTKFYNMDVTEIIKLYPNGIEEIVEKQAKIIYHTSLKNLNSLGLTKYVLRDILDIINSHPHEGEVIYNICKILAEQININTRYVPEWIIIQDPTRQYTASLNPIIEDPEEWYGEGLYIK